MKIVVAEKVAVNALQLLKDEPGWTVVTPEQIKDGLAGELRDADALIVRSAVEVNAEVLRGAGKLRVIGRAGVGVDNIDLEAATKAGIAVMNTPGANAVAVAEHTLALMLGLARHIPRADATTRAGKWEKKSLQGTELRGKTLGIIGLGRVGMEVARRARAFEMKLIAHDPFVTGAVARELGIQLAELDDVFAAADYLTLHVGLTPQTAGMINAASLTKMKKGVRIINCARGGLIVEEDLRAALDSGHVGGAAIDVFPVEPAKESPFFGRDDVIATPHLGAATTEAQENVALQIAEQMSDYLTTGAVVNALNMPSLSAEEAIRLKPYLRLAEQLGNFAGQLTTYELKAVEIAYEGNAADLNVKPLTAIILSAILRPQLDTVNMVNAPVICRERDISVSETRAPSRASYQALIRVTVSSERHKRSVAGTLFGGDKPRIVEVEGIPMEAELGEHMLFVRNKDKPGFIGNLGRTMGEAGINIATLHLGRSEPGGDALCLVQVDQPLSDDILECVRAIPNVILARALRF
jgi:D-3-phosphoglycerate dehydrogenase / 2-oxoglutarate reductase